MHSDIFIELSVILAITGVVSALMKSLRQPLIIGYIFTGLLLGPFFLDLLHSEEAFNSLSQFGIALLLFIIGLGLNPKVIKDVGKAAFLIGAGQIVFTTLLGVAAATLLGFDVRTAFYIAVALAFSSTIIVLKILGDKRETTKLYGRIATGFLLVQDIVATLALIYVAAQDQGGESISEFSMTAGYAILLLVLLALMARSVLPRAMKFLADSQEFLFLFSLAWGFGIASLFVVAGLSVEIGALFAGVALSTQPYAQEVGSRLKPLRDFFILIFFIVLGAELNIGNLSSALGPALIFSGTVLIGNPLIVMTIMGLLGYTKKTSFKTGLTVSQISEFSLIFILLASEVGQVSDEITSIVTLVALITIAGSTYLMLFDEQLYSLLQKHLSLFERRKVSYQQKAPADADIVLFGYARGGHEFVRHFKKMKRKFLIVDYDPEAIDHLKSQGLNYEYGDITDIEFLDEIGIENAKLIVSTITDFQTNLFLTTHIHAMNKNAIIIPHSENTEEAARLYEHGATYVMMPHYIGSERVSQMIRRRTLRKSDFVPAREKHLRYVQSHL